MTEGEGAADPREQGVDSPERACILRALALLDAGDVERARSVLREALGAPAVLAPPWASGPSRAEPGATPPVGAPAFGGALDDDEIDDAIANAETNADEMLSANRVVETTLDVDPSAAPDASFDVLRRPTYATRTMADLLEGQGRTAEANALRATLPRTVQPERQPEPFGAGDADRLRVVSTLESWLHNIRRVRQERDAQDARPQLR